MTDIYVTKLSTTIVESIINESLDRINKDNTLADIPPEQVLLYICTLVLERTKEGLKDQVITSDERVQVITEIVCVLVERLPLSEPLKKIVKCFINDGEIQKLIEELDEKATGKCMKCFGPLLRACIKSNKK